MLEFDIRRDADALPGLTAGEVTALTEAATRATFYTEGMTAEQLAANRRIAEISAATLFGAAAAEHRHLAAAFAEGRLAGFMIATRHAPGDLELDWLMVHPSAHGSGLAVRLMQEGIAWLGEDRPLWLTVIRHNERAIRFYRRFGFEIDRGAQLDRPVPSWIMRRSAPRESG
jgi:ribosomal protein S18 acetylase RimI-like enzyme